MGSMERIHRLQALPEFMDTLNGLEKAEKDRAFCRHSLEHLLDVARLMYIEVLEENLPFRKDQIYAAALLHDLGRFRQITEGIPHNAEGARIAAVLLPQCGFSEEETEQICSAIFLHRGDGKDRTGLAGLLYRADKKSRNCFHCSASEGCNWKAEKRNRFIDG